jgi:hypothetical protein
LAGLRRSALLILHLIPSLPTQVAIYDILLAAMKACTNCGKQQLNGARYCDGCNKRFWTGFTRLIFVVGMVLIGLGIASIPWGIVLVGTGAFLCWMALPQGPGSV